MGRVTAARTLELAPGRVAGTGSPDPALLRGTRPHRAAARPGWLWSPRLGQRGPGQRGGPGAGGVRDRSVQGRAADGVASSCDSRPGPPHRQAGRVPGSHGPDLCRSRGCLGAFRAFITRGRQPGPASGPRVRHRDAPRRGLSPATHVGVTATPGPASPAPWPQPHGGLGGAGSRSVSEETARGSGLSRRKLESPRG